ncbi:MAG: glycosyltransferase [Polaribacter sp.]
MVLKVSIIIPVYNAAEYLQKCLTSAISQTLQDIEIIIIEDASTDGSLKIIKSLKKKTII